jgi:hypothetical protein
MKQLAMIAIVLGGMTAACAQAKTACDFVTQKEAEQLVGAPLAKAVEGKGSSDSNETSCGFFPNGFRLETAEGPPESALKLSVHAMKTADSAKRFYEASYSMSNEAKSQPGSPLANDKITKLKGLGDAAFIVDRASHHTAFVFILKGSALAQVQIWKTAGSPAQIATSAAKQIATKLQ